MLRLLSPVLGLWSVVVGLTGLVLAGVMWILSARRADRTTQALLHGTAQLPGGELPLLLALTVAAAAAAGLIYVALAYKT